MDWRLNQDLLISLPQFPLLIKRSELSIDLLIDDIPGSVVWHICSLQYSQLGILLWKVRGHSLSWVNQITSTVTLYLYWEVIYETFQYTCTLKWLYWNAVWLWLSDLMFFFLLLFLAGLTNSGSIFTCTTLDMHCLYYDLCEWEVIDVSTSLNWHILVIF